MSMTALITHARLPCLRIDVRQYGMKCAELHLLKVVERIHVASIYIEIRACRELRDLLSPIAPLMDRSVKLIHHISNASWK